MNKINHPLVSVIIPCYNYGSYVCDAIDSVISQTYANWELIIINDGSLDNTEDVVMPYTKHDNRIRYHYQPNKGLSAARNTGLALTTGEYIQLLDADDYLAPEKLRLQVEVLNNNPAVDLVYSNAYVFLHSETSRDPINFKPFIFPVSPISGQGIPMLLHMAMDNMFLPGAPLYRRSMETTIKGFKEDMYPIEDWHYWYRGLLENKNYLHDGRREVALYSRHHGDNMSIDRFKMWRNRIIGREAIIPIIKVRMEKSATDTLLFKPVLKKNESLLRQEKARYNLFYGNTYAGIYNVLLAATSSENAFDTLYEGAYLLKERAFGRKIKK
ncbi:MAG: glycosyltransferase [Janthinobacterium lividum]